MELLHNDNKGVTGATYQILEPKVENPEIISSIVALFRKDNVSARPVAEMVSPANFSSEFLTRGS